MNHPFLSVIIPAYNEEKSLPGTLRSVFSYLGKQSYSWEVLVVNDGSEDRTKDLALEFQKSFPELRLIENFKNRGKGFAVKNGVLHSKGDLVLFMDADNSTKINEIEKALPLLRGDITSVLPGQNPLLHSEQFDVIMGSRRLKDSLIVESQPRHRRFLGEFFRVFTKILLDLPYDDTQAGFKIFNQRARRIFDLQTLSGFSFDAELLFLAKKIGLRVKEIPIQWENNASSHVSFKKMAHALAELLKIRFKRYPM
ncbi:MAG: hypothetical protein A2418_02565 [Candidatus Brennerbacteria bacterium RIFOXYC1_FULL_41_11]|uniref:dolichyl-phosphate beta-glucosyltransferase n=1 Tax=Candidatus Brennerbacteria bacterium RIFOXYD1_FULL_41_16 TaxID=1797529 RepID=A0A1G1XJL2_9BACT|nr:MAG: hypothetical protein A2391_02320 [Candidatus Brennerbacteria bacterium RIFOXYB1_FULL_41_13]OGY39066.1 MAG: hypothetical protein A2418_02565 [Candidatus Brennerbacteria bacterium RIFOXYC1_FULL_41_11]OGY40219.1 MAG: hypothetical protein A2570_02945 [Candidatus Brennerbacteria bacterium RIFOXYD1_FULL_41_16]